MSLKNLLVLVLALSLVLCLCACGGNGAQSADPTGTTQDIDADENGNVTYTVTVEDEFGDPISGAMVLLKSDTSVPNGTNDDGVATYTVPKKNYTVSFVTVPEGYAAKAEDYEFPSGEYELVITLTSIDG